MRYGFVLAGGTATEQPGDPRAARALVAPWEDAGCTWWLDARWEMPHESPERMRQVRERMRQVREHLEAGPPRAA